MDTRQFLIGFEADSVKEGDDLRPQPHRQLAIGCGGTKDVAQFGLHAVAVPSRALVQALLHTGINVTDENLGRGSCTRYHDSAWSGQHKGGIVAGASEAPPQEGRGGRLRPDYDRAGGSSAVSMKCQP